MSSREYARVYANLVGSDIKPSHPGGNWGNEDGLQSDNPEQAGSKRKRLPLLKRRKMSSRLLAVCVLFVLASISGKLGSDEPEIAHANSSLQAEDKVRVAKKSAVKKHVVPPKDGARAAVFYLRKAGASKAEISFAVPVCRRESGCRLKAHNLNHSTRDNSWGPWQINYYAELFAGRNKLLGPPETNVSSWARASRNFLKFLRRSGSCHWNPPNYCAG